MCVYIYISSYDIRDLGVTSPADRNRITDSVYICIHYTIFSYPDQT